MTSQDWIIQVNSSDMGNDQVLEPVTETWVRSMPYPNFWTNQSIQMTAGSPINVGDSATIQVQFWGPQTEQEFSTSEVTVIQAWVCYPNTAGSNGQFNTNLVVPSMRTTPPTNAAGFAYSVVPGLSPWQSLSPPWVPTPADVMQVQNDPTLAVDNLGNNEVHACILVNSFGDSQGVPVGVNPASPVNPMGVNVLNNPHVGQLNIAIQGTATPGMKRSPTPGGPDGPAAHLAFLAGVPDIGRRAALNVAVKHVDQGAQIDPTVLRALQASRYASLPLKPSNAPPPTFGLMPNPHALRHGWLCQFFTEIEDELKELLVDFESLIFGRPLPSHKRPKPSVSITTPTSGIYPLLLQAQFDPSEAAGSVHVFDILQTDPVTGEQGGIRVAMVVTA